MDDTESKGLQTAWMNLLLGVAAAYQHAVTSDRLPLAMALSKTLATVTNYAHIFADIQDSVSMGESLFAELDGQRMDCNAAYDEDIADALPDQRFWLYYWRERVETVISDVMSLVSED